MGLMACLFGGCVKRPFVLKGNMKMKKIISVASAAVLALGVVACAEEAAEEAPMEEVAEEAEAAMEDVAAEADAAMEEVAEEAGEAVEAVEEAAE